MSTPQQLMNPQPKRVQKQSKVSCNMCRWWKREEEGTKKSKMSLCTVSCHKSDKGTRREMMKSKLVAIDAGNWGIKRSISQINKVQKLSETD
jgi:hypothetical protein